MPVPFFANSVEDRAVLLGQAGVGEVFDLAKSANLLVVGIGTAEREASLVATGMIEKSEIEEISATAAPANCLAISSTRLARPSRRRCRTGPLRSVARKSGTGGLSQ